MVNPSERVSLQTGGGCLGDKTKERKKNRVHVSTSVADRRMERIGVEWSGGVKVEWQERLPLCCFGQSIKTILPLDKCGGGGQNGPEGYGKGWTDPKGREK